MSAPQSVQINPDIATDFFICCQTEHVIEYKFWVFRAGDKWYPIGPEQTNDERSDHWIFMPPMPKGSIFAYWLGVWGHASTNWSARVQILQHDASILDTAWTVCGEWTEDGKTSDEGNGGGVSTLPSIPKVKLTI